MKKIEMKKILSAVAAVVVLAAVTLLSGVLYGQLSNRWGPSANAVAAAETLESFPLQFGPWRMVDEEELTPYVQDLLMTHGAINRTYVDTQTGDTVNIAVMQGPPGPITVHTPEICYQSRSFRLTGPAEQFELQAGDGTTHTMWALTFRSTDIEANWLRVYYGWSKGTDWFAADKWARIRYASQPYLYKFQLSCTPPPGTDLAAGDPGQRFLQNFFGELQHYLVEP